LSLFYFVTVDCDYVVPIGESYTCYVAESCIYLCA